MRRLLSFLSLIAVPALALALMGAPAVSADSVDHPTMGDSNGKALFVGMKCAKCHSVGTDVACTNKKPEKCSDLKAAGVKQLKKPNVAAYLKKEADRDGKKHKKKFKGTDEELQAIIDWLY